MERRGLVARQGCPTDARGAFIQLTDSGRRAMETAAPGHVETVRACFIDLLSREELDTLSSIADRVIRRIGEGSPQDSPDTGCGGAPRQPPD
jgi:DNA-binding MarR family transcriptional regulator